MRKYNFILIGGALGAVLRLAIKNIHISNYNESIPLNTLIINVTGSFILALFLTVAFEVMEFDADIRLGVSTGFLGAYTTFSTLCKETVVLMANGEYFSAISYLTVSIILGFTGAYFGVVLAREVIAKKINNIMRKSNREIVDEREED